ncbi:MAG: hypothetical protein QW775_04340 [Ignisphaera sp.]|uniref:tRNA (guanine(26)-N(2))-dimethyltransferase n=1 Tax=Ignisphaera aggregans TaxID=334771 RepID=A0A7C4NIU5_9CREN
MDLCLQGFTEVIEGLAKICVPDPKLYVRIDGAYEPAWAPVFYNPNMVENRDIAVEVVEYLVRNTSNKELVVVDPLAATGVRSIRIALEVSKAEYIKSIMGDISEESIKIMKINARLNKLEDRVDIERSDANELMYKLRRLGLKLSYIDVDPFGSPVPFTCSAVSTIKRGGVIAFTATDLAVLEGKHQDKIIRRYGVMGSLTPISKDVSVRVLLSYIARIASSLDKYIEPLVSYVYKHYVRVYVRIYEGANRALNQMKTCLKALRICTRCGYSYIDDDGDQKSLCSFCRSPTIKVAPVWICKTMNKDLIRSLVEDIASKPWMQKSSKQLLKQLDDYAVIDEITVRLSLLARALRTNTPSRDKVVECLRNIGYKAAKSYTYADGIVSSASIYDIVQCFK